VRFYCGNLDLSSDALIAQQNRYLETIPPPLLAARCRPAGRGEAGGEHGNKSRMMIAGGSDHHPRKREDRTFFRMPQSAIGGKREEGRGEREKGKKKRERERENRTHSLAFAGRSRFRGGGTFPPAFAGIRDG